jgi:hypothetical protein
MCEDIDTYEVNSTYRSNLESHIMMMCGSFHKSFSAREEMRRSGTSICQVMQDVAALVSVIQKQQLKSPHLPYLSSDVHLPGRRATHTCREIQTVFQVSNQTSEGAAECPNTFFQV